MLVDLKPHTPRECRLRPNGFKCSVNQGAVGDANNVYTEELAQNIASLALDSNGETIDKDNVQASIVLKPPGIPVTGHNISYKRLFSGSGIPHKMSKYESCDYCGLVFADNADLQRHLWKGTKCDSEEDVLEEELNVKSIKRNRLFLEDEGLHRFYKIVLTVNKDYLREKREHYIRKDYSSDIVQKKMDKIIWHLFKESYTCFLTCLYFMRNGQIAQTLVDSIHDKSQLETELPRKLNKVKKDCFQDIRDNECDGYSSSSDSTILVFSIGI